MKRLVLIVLTIVLAGVGVFFGWRYYSDVYLPNKQVTDADKQQRELFEEIKPKAVREFEPEQPKQETATDSAAAQSAQAALEALPANRDDAVGWIKIDGTVIDYPVVQTTDNSYYLENGLNGAYNYGLGCPFLDYRCKNDFTDFNSIIYAHHIQYYQAMFSDITLYKDESFMRSHPYGTLMTKNGVHRVRFFAYMIIDNPSFAYVTGVTDKAEQNAYIDDIFSAAYYTPLCTAQELKNNKGLHLLLLSTCTYEYWSAKGVLVGVIE